MNLTSEQQVDDITEDEDIELFEGDWYQEPDVGTDIDDGMDYTALCLIQGLSANIKY